MKEPVSVTFTTPILILPISLHPAQRHSRPNCRRVPLNLLFLDKLALAVQFGGEKYLKTLKTCITSVTRGLRVSLLSPLVAGLMGVPDFSPSITVVKKGQILLTQAHHFIRVYWGVDAAEVPLIIAATYNCELMLCPVHPYLVLCRKGEVLVSHLRPIPFLTQTGNRPSKWIYR